MEGKSIVRRRARTKRTTRLVQVKPLRRIYI